MENEATTYYHLGDSGRERRSVNQSRHEWARDGNGVREFHCKTMEGHWDGLLNFLRPFRGISK